MDKNKIIFNKKFIERMTRDRIKYCHYWLRREDITIVMSPSSYKRVLKQSEIDLVWVDEKESNNIKDFKKEMIDFKNWREENNRDIKYIGKWGNKYG